MLRRTADLIRLRYPAGVSADITRVRFPRRSGMRPTWNAIIRRPGGSHLKTAFRSPVEAAEWADRQAGSRRIETTYPDV